jgi:hypothetical protein
MKWFRRPAPAPDRRVEAAEDRARLAVTALEGCAALLGRQIDGSAQALALALVQTFCDALVASSPHLRLAWVWFGQPDTDTLTPARRPAPLGQPGALGR